MGRRAAARNNESEVHREAVAQTLLFWQPRESKCLNAEDGRQMIENVAGFFGLLATWEADQHTEEASVPLKYSNVTEIVGVAHEPTKEPEFKQENTDCSPASDFLAA